MKKRLLEFLAYLGIGQNKFEEKVGLSIGYINKLSGDMKLNTINKIISTYPELDKEWLIAGKGAMLKSESDSAQFYEPESAPFDNKKRIPFYDDVVSIGGINERSAGMESNSTPAEWIDPGDWFKNATAALRHYGDSMVDYPAGCILALKEVQDRRLIVPGKDYVIETSEYRVTKKVQLCSDPEYIRAYSTNDEKYDDGTLVHQPFNIPLSLVGRIFEVLGYVVKKGGGTIVFSNQQK